MSCAFLDAGTFTEGEGFTFEPTIRGVKEAAIIDAALLGSADAHKLDEYAARLQEAYRNLAKKRHRNAEAEHSTQLSPMTSMTAAAKA